MVAPSKAGDEGPLAVREYAAERRVLYVEDVVANVTLVGEVPACLPAACGCCLRCWAGWAWSSRRSTCPT